MSHHLLDFLYVFIYSNMMVVDLPYEHLVLDSKLSTCFCLFTSSYIVNLKKTLYTDDLLK